MKKNKNMYRIVIIIAITIVAVTVVLFLFGLSKKDSEPLLLDTVTKKQSDNIIKEEIDIAFGNIENENLKEGTFQVNYVLKNLTNLDKAFCLEVVALDSKKNEIARGEIFHEFIPKDEGVSSSVTMYMSSEADLSKVKFSVTKAFSAEVSDDDHKMNKKSLEK